MFLYHVKTWSKNTVYKTKARGCKKPLTMTVKPTWTSTKYSAFIILLLFVFIVIKNVFYQMEKKSIKKVIFQFCAKNL